MKHKRNPAAERRQAKRAATVWQPPPVHPLLTIATRADFEAWAARPYWAHFEAACLTCGYVPPATYGEFWAHLPSYPQLLRERWARICQAIESGELQAVKGGEQ